MQFRRRDHAALPAQAQLGAFLLPHHPRRPDILPYACAVLIGVAAALLVLPVQTILGAGPGWSAPFTDQAQTLAGHLAYQADAWRWPLLRAEPLFWPRGVSVALTDSNPLVSLLAKSWTKLTGAGPVNLLGAWLAACWIAQPVAAVYAARGLRLGTVPCLAAGVLAASWPALLMRMGHINLCGHFLILLALGLVFRRLRARESLREGVLEGGGGWLAPALLLLVAVLVHPYLFQIDALLLAAVPLQAALDRRAGWWRDAAGYLAGCVAAVGLLELISGPLGGGDKGFVLFSMNLLSPIWPQLSGVFGANLPILDATGGQAEGFNWLGAGVLLLVVAAVAGAVRQRPNWRPVRALLLVLVGLALLSLSSRVYAGPVKLIDLGAKPWEDIFGTFRASGRAFWPVGYAVMLGAVAAAARRRWGWVLLVAAAGLQVVDAGPLRVAARQAWERGAAIPVLPVPQGTQLFSVAPYPGCFPNAPARAEQAVMLLDATRAGARLGDIGLGRPPPWFKCENLLSDMMQLPLRPGETRAYFGAATMAALRPEWLGPDAACHALARAILCGRGVGPIGGAPIPAARAPDSAVLPLTLAGPALAPVLSSGWRDGGDGQAWSEGPRGTLMLDVPADTSLVLTLRVMGVADRPGGTRDIEASVGAGSAGRFTLLDGQAGDIVLHLPPQPAGPVRVALDAARPIDPMKRGMTAPVHRAAIRLLGITLRAG